MLVAEVLYIKNLAPIDKIATNKKGTGFYFALKLNYRLLNNNKNKKNSFECKPFNPELPPRLPPLHLKMSLVFVLKDTWCHSILKI